jgi:AcrR family transcriptional regulator
MPSGSAALARRQLSLVVVLKCQYDRNAIVRQVVDAKIRAGVSTPVVGAPTAMTWGDRPEVGSRARGADMARYDEAHKQQSRRRIVDAAARRFKTDGIDGSGIATLMKDAGLTNGAFYGHFDSKEDLVRAAVGHQLESQRELMAGLEPGVEGLRQFVRTYLSVEHRDDIGGGCPSAALLDEIARCADTTRVSYTDGMTEMVDDLAGRLTGVDASSARVQVLGLFASMVGVLQLSRAVTDPALSEEVLDQGVRNALVLIDAACTD